MEIYSELLKQYEQEKLKMVNGEEVNKLELMFIGYALDAVDTAKRNFKIDLDFSESSIEKVEKILDILHKTLEQSKPSQDVILTFSKQFAGYIGQVMKIRWGGIWKDESSYEIKNGPALYVKNHDLFLLSKVYRRITNGSEDNVYHFYQVIKKDIEGTSDLREFTIDDLKEKRKGNWFKRLFGR